MTILTGPWPARVTWAPLPLLLGPALGNALDQHSHAVGRTASLLAWGAWAAVLVAVLLPTTASLTALRIAAPAAMAIAAWAAAVGDARVADIVAVAGGALVIVATFSPMTGDIFVNGSSYGDERRLALRVPGPLVLGPIPLAWIAAVAAPVGGPLLLASQQWVAGTVVLAVGLPVAWVAVRALHGLARRWVVLVPAGLVLHDPHALAEAVLFPRRTVRSVGPASAESAADALDLSQRAFGSLAVELALTEPALVTPRRGRGPVESVPTERLLFMPTRPGALLTEASARRLPNA